MPRAWNLSRLSVLRRKPPPLPKRDVPLSRTPRPVDGDWGEVYRVQAPRVRRLAVRLVGEGRADDVVQETFLRAYRNRDALDPRRSVEPWLAAIARRAAIDALRRGQAVTKAETAAVENGRRMAADDPVADAVFNGIRRTGVEQSFGGLSPRHRLVLLAHEGQDVGASVDAEGSAFRSVLARARRGFRQRYLDFARDSGVFGAGSIAGGTTSRVRGWLARSQSATPDRIATVVAACTVVLVASGTTARSPEQLEGSHIAADTSSAVAHQAGGGGGSMAIPRASFSLQPTLSSESIGVDGDAHVRADTAGGPSVGADVDWRFGVTGPTASISIEVWLSTPVHTTHTWVGNTVECDSGTVASLECKAIDVVPADSRHEQVGADV